MYWGIVNYMKSLNDYLEDIDVSDSMYELATARYESLVDFIQKSELKQYEPDIFLQGSIKLGTMIKPLTDDGSYDIDIVCKLNNLSYHDISQFDLKECIGKVLQAYNNEKPFKNPIKNGKRCWTLTYVDKFNFHIDILPAISHDLSSNNLNYSDFICITDKSNPNYKIITSDWEISNPKGYYDWFKEQEQFNIFRDKIVLESRSSTEKIPDYKVKTELRRIIQLLKRHAEVMFRDSPEYKPSSIIITTLAAKAYPTIKPDISFDEKVDILIWDLTNYLDKDSDNQPCILNPANQTENLSLKWKNNKEYFDQFIKWIEKLKLDFAVNESRTLINENLRESLQVGRYYEIEQINRLAHHQKPKWKYANKIFNISIKAYKQLDLDRKEHFESGSPIYNKYTLLFEVENEWSKNYDLYWQVTNTGREAREANCLRGEFIGPIHSKYGRYTHCEETKYRGEHYIEAYLVKNNICYGRSKPFIVNLKF